MGIFRLTGVFGIFGTPDNQRLSLFAYAFALMAGALIYYALEKPLTRLRATVRRHAPEVSVTQR